MKPTIQLWRSGFVNRWHSDDSHALRNSQDTTGGHGYRVALLLKALNPEADAHMVLCALTHDAQEKATCDVPSDMKRDPELNKILKRLEGKAAEEMGLPFVDEDDEIWIKLCDKLDAYLWVASVDPKVLVTEKWSEIYERIMNMAEQLDVDGPVGELLKA